MTKHPVQLSERDIKVIRHLRNKGFAVCVFTPGEVNKAPIEDIEDAMCSAGWNAIGYLNQTNKETV